jgi:hypothetical protein
VRTTGDVISQTVKNLLMEAVREDQDALIVSTPTKEYNRKVHDLADFLGVSRPYMPRKIQSGSWSARDLDRLAIYFRKYPQDFVPGPHDEGWALSDRAPEGNASTDVSASGDNPEMHSGA